jgi:hypothetical protein
VGLGLVCGVVLKYAGKLHSFYYDDREYFHISEVKYEDVEELVNKIAELGTNV